MDKKSVKINDCRIYKEMQGQIVLLWYPEGAKIPEFKNIKTIESGIKIAKRMKFDGIRLSNLYTEKNLSELIIKYNLKPEITKSKKIKADLFLF